MSGTFRAGQQVEDYCRACKTDRQHTIIAVDNEAMRVICDYCQSQHNYRGGPRVDAPAELRPLRATEASSASVPRSRPSAPPAVPDAFPLVSDRERRSAPIMMSGETTDLELMLRRVIREETGLTPAAPAEKGRGGDLVLKPGRPGVQEKSWPIETFFHKIVMLRNRLRTLEQQVNASELPEDQKLRLQGYISGCYGSLTSFNVLFADESDQFKGSGGD
jgi:hypothetical protein